MQTNVRSFGWLKAPIFGLMVCAFASIVMKIAGGLVMVWGAALDAIEACYDASWGHGLEPLASVYIILATIVVCWVAALYSVRFAIRFASRILLSDRGSFPSEEKQAVGHQETDQAARSKRRRAACWFGVVAAAPALIWGCDRGMSELQRRSVINCFRTADRISVEYEFSERDDSKDDFTFFTGRHEITDKQQLAAIARDLSGIRLDEFQSNCLFIVPGGMVTNWGAPFEVSVYNSEDAAPRQFLVNTEALYERGRDGRVFLHNGMGVLAGLIYQVLEPHQQLWN